MNTTSILKKSVFPGLVLHTVLLCACNTGENNKTEKRAAYTIPDSLMKTLTMDTVKITGLTRSIKFNGVVDFNPDKVANIYPMISGNVQDIKVMLGDYVKAGQVLGLVKSSEMANYSAALQNAEANIQLTARQLQQQKELFKSGLASQVDVTNAEATYQQASAAKTAAERILTINGNNRQGEYAIKSPIDGFIVQKNINNGMAIRTDNANNLFTISDLKEVWVQANVYEANIDKVHQGDEAAVTTISYPNKIFTGRVGKLMNVLDPTNRVLKMRVVLPNTDYKLKPQMFATVTVNNNEDKDAICISAASLIFDHSQYFVLLYKNQKDVQIRPVEIISINGSKAFIKSGIQPGDVLIGSMLVQIYGALNN
jgi:cobalt-zinc-cadmium efflux system membrane fusion protein